MRTKWHLRNEPTSFFSESPAFRPKSTCKTHLGHPNIEVFLGQSKKENFTKDTRIYLRKNDRRYVLQPMTVIL